jgi:hypothetical protein
LLLVGDFLRQIRDGLKGRSIARAAVQEAFLDREVIQVRIDALAVLLPFCLPYNQRWNAT